MKTISKINLKRGIVVACIVLALLLVTFRPVQGMMGDMHILISLWRFEKEILQGTPAGQYFEGMAWAHLFEAIRILREHSEHGNDLQTLAYFLLPNLDALLNGKGDTVVITQDQIEAVKVEADWWLSVASPSFQADIQKTLGLYPLDQFVEMTMSEALEHVNLHFTELWEEHLVEGTGGKWAYYTYKGVYFEYPAKWYVQVHEDPYGGSGNLFVIPSKESNSQWDANVTVFEAWEIIPDPTQPFDLHREIDYYPDTKWEETVTVDGMEGYYFIRPSTQVELIGVFESILYNEEKNTKIRITAILFQPDGLLFGFDGEKIREKYEYLFHLTESVRLR